MSQPGSDFSVLIGAYERGNLLYIRAVTPLHVGIGRAGGVIDLPVQKDLYGYPEIYGSSLKGSLRASCMRKARRDECIGYFGSEPGEAESKPGKVVVLDTKLLLIPVRVLRGVYGYITSPLLLKQFIDYLSIIKHEKYEELLEVVEDISKDLDRDKVLVTSKAKNKYSIKINNKDKIIINEEFWLEPLIKNEDVKKILNIIPDELRKKIGLEEDSLLIVSDEDDTSLQIAEKSLIRLQRIRLEETKKIVARGQLWSEEYVPRNTILYTIILYTDEKTMNEFKEKVLGGGRSYLIIGGHETIGKGLTELYVV